MTEILLVHGAWHGGWCWRLVADSLRAEGFRVLTPTLTGLGERAHLLSASTGVSQHRDDLLAVIEAEELEKVLIVGHSYGAMPAALAAEHPAVVGFLSLDGVPVVPGRALNDMLPEKVVAAARATCINGPALPPPPPETFDVPADHPAHGWAARRTTPMPWACLAEPLPPTGPRFAALPKRYVAALRNSLAGPAAGRAQAEAEGWTLVVIDSGHDLPLTAPEETAEAIARAANWSGTA
ncbi:alpha/beta fold hydrolase [Thermaurantiacus sp.]